MSYRVQAMVIDEDGWTKPSPLAGAEADTLEGAREEYRRTKARLWEIGFMLQDACIVGPQNEMYSVQEEQATMSDEIQQIAARIVQSDWEDAPGGDDYQILTNRIADALRDTASAETADIRAQLDAARLTIKKARERLYDAHGRGIHEMYQVILAVGTILREEAQQ